MKSCVNLKRQYCVKCRVQVADTTLYPCKHDSYCLTCIVQLKELNCPLCETYIKYVDTEAGALPLSIILKMIKWSYEMNEPQIIEKLKQTKYLLGGCAQYSETKSRRINKVKNFMNKCFPALCVSLVNSKFDNLQITNQN